MSYLKRLEALLKQNGQDSLVITSKKNRLKAPRECILFNCIEAIELSGTF